MREAFNYLVANLLWISSGWQKTRAFHAALRRPRATQEGRLISLLKQNARSDYGRRYAFERVRSIREFQDAVPIVTYDSLGEEIEAIKRGRERVLTEEPVLWLEKTTGSTGAAKYIPYTANLKREFQAAVAPWMADLYRHRRKMLLGGSYWSITPLAAVPEVTQGGLRVGCDDEREYFGKLDRKLLDRLILVPAELAKVSDVESGRYVTLRFLLETPRLAFISVWNPSFLTLLVGLLEEHGARLIEDIRRGTLTPPRALPSHLHASLARGLAPRPSRARELEEILRRLGKLAPIEVWPKLSLISCWASGNARNFLPELQSLFPGVEIQPKGLLATEGVVSIPILGHPGGALALTSHFFEFIPEGGSRARPLLADELDNGQIYKVLLTTGGGLYRYDLGDWIQVVGYVGETPLVEFIGKESAVSDLCGEKLHAARVETALGAALAEFRLTPSFAMLAPEWGWPPRYCLLIEASGVSADILAQLADRLDELLREGHHYAYCRRLGQLGPLQALPVRDGARRYLERCVALGQRLGSIKPTALHCKPGWSVWFERAAGDRDGNVHEPLHI
ncbi:MAG TPA: GH3 auxin-responsive promoter family protein [Candidatus Acidoferrales bacterium]|nr:GH3 auxin-responsive promoter family protein [Candidatus Acidoferrales bacterium]